MQGIIYKKIAIRCNTKDQAMAIVRRCHQYGIGWIDGHNASRTNFDPIEPNMAYDLLEGHINWANEEYYLKNEWEMIEFEEFMKSTSVIWIVPDIDFDVD